MQYNWKIQHLTPSQKEIADHLAVDLHITETEAALLVRRNLLTAESARAFIRPALTMLHDPFLMKDMDKAIDRIDTALANSERIMIYGDYDVDGTTAVSLVYSFFRGFTDLLDFYIPDRFKEGYGISFQGIDVAQQKGCTLMIALDCGIKAVDKVEYARERGIDMIICDHHEPGDELPRAIAVLDAKRKDNTYPYNELSGCGVGFKLVQAYAQKHNISETKYHYLLALCAMSIASDIVPITGENRVLAYYGLKVLNTRPTVGINAIIQIAGLQGKVITIADLGFKIGPRINACGRMKSGAEAVKLLLTEDTAYAQQLAQAINEYNTERRQYDTTTAQEALEMLAQDPDNDTKHTTVVYSPSCFYRSRKRTDMRIRALGGGL